MSNGIFMGHDGGNNSNIISMIDKNKDKAIIIPTVLSPFQDYDGGLSDDSDELEDNLEVEIIMHTNNPNETEDLGKFRVGNYAIEKEIGNVISRNTGSKKVGDKNLMICSLTNMALAITQDLNKEEGRITSVIKGFVTSLPYKEYKIKADNEAYAKQFLGKHLVRFRGNYNIDVEMKIENVEVQCEGAALIDSYLYKENGEPRYSLDEILDKMFVIVEIGEITTEVIAVMFTETKKGIKLKFIDKLCTGFDIGIANAKQDIINKFRELNKKIDKHAIDHAIKRKGRKGIIDVGKEEVDIKESYKEALELVVADVISIEVANLINTANSPYSIHEILVAGGGANAYNNICGDRVCEKLEELLDTICIIPDNALTGNADGNLERAIALFDEE